MIIRIEVFQFWMIVAASMLGLFHFGSVLPAVYFGFGVVAFIETIKQAFERGVELVLR